MEIQVGQILIKIILLGKIENESQKMKVFVQIPYEIGWIENLKCIVRRQWNEKTVNLCHVKNQENFAFFEGNFNLEICALYHIYFSLEINGFFKYLKKENINGDKYVSNEECWKLSVGFNVPEWAKNGNMYHIFVDRFKRGETQKLPNMPRRYVHSDWNEMPVIGPNSKNEWNVDFFGGDLKGIIQSIKYLKKMGITILYLSPIMKSQSNHRYDTGDYEIVDPYVGTNADLKKLCDIAHQNGIYVIVDAVFNHTGNDSKYFNQYGNYPTIGAYQSENSPYYDFYKKSKKGDKVEFSKWWGMQNLPECDGNSEKWKTYILGEGGIIDKWFELGIDGLRADVADELTDEFIEGMRIAIRRNNPQGLFIGEVWKNPMRMNRGYLSSGKGMDSVMNYFIMDPLIRYFKYADINLIVSKIKEFLTEYPTESIFTAMNFSSTHDISRIVEIFGCNEFQENGEWSWNLKNNNLEWIKQHHLTAKQYKQGKAIFEAYLVVLTIMPGILSIFYGDEVGIQGIGNLANRMPYPWGKRDKKLLKFVRKCLNLRKKEKMLKSAELKIVWVKYESIALERFLGDCKIIAIVNRTNRDIKYEIPRGYENAIELLTLRKKENFIGPYGAVLLKTCW